MTKLIDLKEVSCGNCPHWRRRREPGNQDKGYCGPRCDITRNITTERDQYCLDHPALVEQVEARRAELLAAALATALAPIIKAATKPQAAAS